MGLALGAVGGAGWSGGGRLRARATGAAVRSVDGHSRRPPRLRCGEIAGAYFLAAFAGGVGFRHYEHGHEYNRRVHDGAETVEKFGELAVILLIGGMVGIAGLQAPGLCGWLLVPVLLVVIRPLAVGVSLVMDPASAAGEVHRLVRCVRGVGSLYYAAVAVAAWCCGGGTEIVVWTALACVMVSIVVRPDRNPGEPSHGAAQERAIEAQEAPVRTPTWPDWTAVAAGCRARTAQRERAGAIAPWRSSR